MNDQMHKAMNQEQMKMHTDVLKLYTKLDINVCIINIKEFETSFKEGGYACIQWDTYVTDIFLMRYEIKFIN